MPRYLFHTIDVGYSRAKDRGSLHNQIPFLKTFSKELARWRAFCFGTAHSAIICCMRQNTLFEPEPEERVEETTDMNAPLADRMRPKTLEDYLGQTALVGQGQMLRQMIEQDRVPSMILWGPPGVGKTTLARIIARHTRRRFVNFSAVQSGIKEIREVMNQAARDKAAGTGTIIFVDEIHRFNKAQQDAFLPYVEAGDITLVGATTENPSFQLNSALLSRCRVFTLESLQPEDLVRLLHRALESQEGLGSLSVDISEDQISRIASLAHGDARFCLNTLEMAVSAAGQDVSGIHITDDLLAGVLARKSMLYDKDGEEHYNVISAFHKSIRNSDADAALYWLARMLEAGEDPLYPARRMIRMASEDVGMADSRALEIAVAAYQAASYLGMPECNVHLAHAAVYLALAPKSNAMETAYFAARDDARATLDKAVPIHLRNASTRLMKELGYGQGYEYSHDYPMHMTDMVCLPDSLKERVYYHPSDQGSEQAVRRRLAQIRAVKADCARRRRNKS